METVSVVVAMDTAAVAMETVARDGPVLRQKYVIIKRDRLWATNRAVAIDARSPAFEGGCNFR